MDDLSIINAAMNIRSFIDQWETRAALAAEIGVKTDAVHKWAQKEAIPTKYHFSVLTAANRRGFAIDPMRLAEMHAKTGSAEQ
jgi:hypothetical protein